MEITFSVPSTAGIAKKLQRKLRQMLRATEVEVGFFARDVHPEAHMPVAQVAYLNEVGDPGAGRPPRPFFRYAVAEYSSQWGEAFGAGMKATGLDTRAAFTGLGELMKSQLQAVILTWSEPPNSPATIRRKGGINDPLKETWFMIEHVRYKVS